MIKPTDINDDNVRDLARPLAIAQAEWAKELAVDAFTNGASDDGWDYASGAVDLFGTMTFIMWEGSANDLRFVLFGGIEDEHASLFNVNQVACDGVCPELQVYWADV